MSATLDPGPVAAFLGGCPTIESRGRLHPVDILYIVPRRPPGRPRRHPPHRSPPGCAGCSRPRRGTCWSSCPAWGRSSAAPRRSPGLAAEQDLAVLPLYGDLAAERQDAVLRPLRRRKVVLATNVAESSITIDGVTAVVDSGAGPPAPLRSVHRARPPGAGQGEPRLGRPARRPRRTPGARGLPAPLAGLGAGDPAGAGDPRDRPRRPRRPGPPAPRLGGARPRGLRLVRGARSGGPGSRHPPAPPARRDRRSRRRHRPWAAPWRACRSTLASAGSSSRGSRLGHPREAALLAALLSERDPFPRVPGARRRSPSRASRSDLLDRLDALEAFERRESSTGDLNAGAARFVLKARDQLLRSSGGPGRHGWNGGSGGGATRPGRSPSSAPSSPPIRTASPAAASRAARAASWWAAAGCASPRRAPCWRPRSSSASTSTPAAPVPSPRRWSARRRRSSRSGSLPERLRTTVDLEFDAARERVAAWKRTRYEDLVIAEAEVPPPDAAADRAGARRGRRGAARPGAGAGRPGGRRLPRPPPQPGGLVPRAAASRGSPRTRSAASSPPSPPAASPSPSCGAPRSSTCSRAPSPTSSSKPCAARLPSGWRCRAAARSRIAYEPGKPPVLAARIQEMFGLAETPRVAAGRVPVLLHLLAPNGRPQQVTHDLRSFWENTYPQVRKELAGRYPRHAWPQDPWNAPPQRRPSGAEPRSSSAAPPRSAGTPRSPPSAASVPARPASQRSSTW